MSIQQSMSQTKKQRVINLREQGHTYGEIAEAVGLGKTYVYRTLKEAGMIGMNRISAAKKREVIHLYERGLTYRQVAERTGVARSSCCEICQAAGVNRPPTEAQRRFHGIDDEAAERALDLYDAGMSREAIAKITGLKEHQITQYAKTAGIIRTTKEAARNRFNNPLHHLARQRKRKIRRAKQLRYQGVTLDRIAEVLNIHKHTASEYVNHE